MISFILTLKRLVTALIHAFKEKEFQVLFFLILLTLVSGSIFYSTVENLAVLDALYFSVMTLTTVGDDSFTPSTTFGKLFTMVYAIAGIGLMFGFISKIAFSMQSGYLNRDKKEDEK